MEYEKEILSGYFFFLYPKLNQSLKLAFDYIIISNNKCWEKNIDVLLDRFFESLEFNFHREFSRYIIKVSKVKGSFYVLVKKPRGKILGDDLRNLFRDVKYISEKVYSKFADYSKSFRFGYFPCCKPVRCYGNYQYNVNPVNPENNIYSIDLI